MESAGLRITRGTVPLSGVFESAFYGVYTTVAMKVPTVIVRGDVLTT